MDRIHTKIVKFLIALIFSPLFLSSTNANAVPVDVAFVVDQSGSMGPEFAFIPGAITALETALNALPLVTSTRYGVMGYMERSGNEALGTHSNNDNLVYVDLTSTIANVTGAVSPAPTLYCCGEYGYHAAYQATLGFNWNVDAVKIIVLLTDEAGRQGPSAQNYLIPDTTAGDAESDLGNILDTGNFLLNVITTTSLYNQWDDAVFSTNNFLGLFDISQLRTDAAQFTQNFVSAKISEVGEVICDPRTDPNQCATVPEPSTLFLLGLGILVATTARRKKLL